jgi:putative SOS response-associated peptidase YedK
MAGIWENWENHAGEIIRSFSIITTRANSLVEGIHDRMPVILMREDEKKWLSSTQEEDLLELLKPYPSERMITYPVSQKVNSPLNDVPEILESI